MVTICGVLAVLTIPPIREGHESGARAIVTTDLASRRIAKCFTRALRVDISRAYEHYMTHDRALESARQMIRAIRHAANGAALCTSVKRRLNVLNALTAIFATRERRVSPGLVLISGTLERTSITSPAVG